MNNVDFTFCELREREVINITDGKRLGRVIDIGIHCNGSIIGLVVPGERRFFKNISGNENIFIPWKDILRIGDDVILVQLICRVPDRGPERDLLGKGPEF